MPDETLRAGFIKDAAAAAIKGVNDSTELAVAVLNGGIDISQDAIAKINDLKRQLLDELNKVVGAV